MASLIDRQSFNLANSVVCCTAVHTWSRGSFFDFFILLFHVQSYRVKAIINKTGLGMGWGVWGLRVLGHGFLRLPKDLGNIEKWCENKRNVVVWQCHPQFTTVFGSILVKWQQSQ